MDPNKLFKLSGAARFLSDALKGEQNIIVNEAVAILVIGLQEELINYGQKEIRRNPEASYKDVEVSRPSPGWDGRSNKP